MEARGDYRRRRPGCSDSSNSPAATADGRRVEVGANVGSAGDVADAFARGADGIGLFRTEMLFMAAVTAPSEEEQFEYIAGRSSMRAAGR